MSAGRPVRSFYTNDDNQVHPMVCQPETLAATFDGVTNASPGGPATRSDRIKISKAKREYGCGARCITAEWDGTAPAGYDVRGQICIAVPDPAVYNGVTVFGPGTYLGANITVVGKQPETVR